MALIVPALCFFLLLFMALKSGKIQNCYLWVPEFFPFDISDVKPDAILSSWQGNSPDEQDDQHSEGEKGGEVYHLGKKVQV